MMPARMQVHHTRVASQPVRRLSDVSTTSAELLLLRIEEDDSCSDDAAATTRIGGGASSSSSSSVRAPTARTPSPAGGGFTGLGSGSSRLRGTPPRLAGARSPSSPPITIVRSRPGSATSEVASGTTTPDRSAATSRRGSNSGSGATPGVASSRELAASSDMEPRPRLATCNNCSTRFLPLTAPDRTSPGRPSSIAAAGAAPTGSRGSYQPDLFCSRDCHGECVMASTSLTQQLPAPSLTRCIFVYCVP